MATTTTGAATAKISAAWAKALEVGSAASSPTLTQQTTFANGTGAGNIENVISKVGSIVASGLANLDLAGVEADPGGDLVTFTKVKAFLVKNTSASGDGISVGGTFIAWKLAANDEVVVPPGGCFMMTAPSAAGFAVTAGSADIMTLANLDVAIAQTYEVIVLGEVS